MTLIDWRQDVERQLRTRNERQTQPFAGVYESYLSLWREFCRAQTQASELRNQMLIVQHEAQEAISAGDNSAAVQKLTQKLAAVQEELKQRYKTNAADLQEKFTLVKRVQELEKTVADLTTKTTEQTIALERYKDFEKNLTNAADQFRSEKHALLTELESLRCRVDAAEKRSAQLEKQNNELVQRIIEEKNKTAEEFNKMNMIIENTRQRSGSGWFGRGRTQSQDAVLVERPEGDTKVDGEEVTALWPMSDVTPPTVASLKLQCHSDEINDVVIETTGKYFATAGTDNLVKVWEIPSGRLKQECRGSLEPVNCVDMRGSLVLGASNDRSCRVWNIQTGRVHQVLTGHANKIQGAKFIGNDGVQVLTGSADRTMKVWNISVNPAKCVQTMRATSVINAVDATYDGQTGVSAHQDGGIRFWDLRSGERVHQIAQLHDAHVTSVCFSPKGELQLVTCSRDNTLKIVDTRTFQVVRTLRHDGFRVAGNSARASYSPDGSMVAAGSGGGELIIWDTIGGDVVSQLREHESPVISCYWGTRKQIVSCDKSGMVVLWS